MIVDRDLYPPIACQFVHNLLKFINPDGHLRHQVAAVKVPNVAKSDDLAGACVPNDERLIALRAACTFSFAIPPLV
jgi:hypothetical protein